jgi:hypothetical protein
MFDSIKLSPQKEEEVDGNPQDVSHATLIP